MGSIERRWLKRDFAVSRVDRRQSCGWTRRRRPHQSWLVGERCWSWSRYRHQSMVCRVCECSRWLSGFNGTSFVASRRWSAVRIKIPSDHDSRHGSSSSALGRSPRSRCVAFGHRRLDGWNASTRVGSDIPRASSFGCSDRYMCASFRSANCVGINWTSCHHQ